MNDGDYRVVVISPGMTTDPLSRDARIVLTKSLQRVIYVLKRDGTWIESPEGVGLADDIGYVFPIDSIEAVGQAIDRYLGNALHAATETKVLRDWLAVEMKRTDMLIDLAVSPRVIDMRQPGIELPQQFKSKS